MHTNERHTLGGRILLLVMTLCSLQPLQHVADGWSDGRALRYGAQVQTGPVLLVELQDCGHLVADGLSQML